VTDVTAPDRTAASGQPLAQAVCTAAVGAPPGKIDLFEWLRTLPDREYRRCAPPDHKAAGYTVSDDGQPLTVAVETIGTSLLVHHYEYRAARRDHCRLVSLSDVLTPAGWTTCQVTWDLRAEPTAGPSDSSSDSPSDGPADGPAGDQASHLTSSVTVHPTAAFTELVAAGGPGRAETAAAWQAALDDHCRRETALLAVSVGRHANAVN
jgi:hypothetical protein